jgi:radical SAM protein with 4Fe4S-binding SPASM domain
MSKNSYQNLKGKSSLNGYELHTLRNKISPLVRIVWEITAKCNLKCKFCCVGNCSENDVSEKEALSISKNIAEYAPFEITITGGEPLLRTNLREIINPLAEKDVEISLNTNGLLFDKATSEELYEAGVKRVRIGLDGSSPPINDSLRGKGSFSKIIRAITTAVETGFEVSVSSLVTKMNMADVESLIEFVHGLGATYILLNDLKIAGNAEEYHRQLSISSQKDLIELGTLIKRTKEEFKRFVRWSEDPSFWLKLGDIDQFKELVSSKSQLGVFGVCGVGITSFSIKCNGEVVPCLFMRDYICGNAVREKISDIWKRSEKFKAIRDLSNMSMKEFTAECKTCDKNTICVGKCLAKIFNVYKRFDNIPSCVLEV